MRVWIPTAICLSVFLYSNWAVHLAKQSYFPPGTTYKVEVTVTGPDGTVIPAVELLEH